MLLKGALTPEVSDEILEFFFGKVWDKNCITLFLYNSGESYSFRKGAVGINEKECLNET